MDPRISEIKDLLDRAQELMGEIIAEQEPAEDVSMDKAKYLAQPEEARLAIDQKRVMARKPKEEMEG